MSKNQDVVKWLRQLQQNSWEPEIFLSGIIVFSLFQIPDLLEEYRIYLSREIDVGNNFDLLFSFFYVGIYWLIFGFVFHLFTRGLWGSLIGLSYVFPKGIKKEKLLYSGKFRHRLDKMESLEANINKIEILSSSIFSFTFLMFMSMIAVTLWMVVLLIIVYLIIFAGFDPSIPAHATAFFTLLWVYIGLSFIYLFDFISLGLLKRSKVIARIFYPIHWFFSRIALSWLYSHIYYTYVSNFRKWKIIVAVLIYIFISVCGVIWKLSDVTLGEGAHYTSIELFNRNTDNFIDPKNYEDQDGTNASDATIQSDIIKSNILKLFIVHQYKFEKFADYDCEYLTNQDSVYQKQEEVAAINDCINKIYQIEIDGVSYNDLNWYLHIKHPNGQKGYINWMDIKALSKGIHKLTVRVDVGTRVITYASIPFFKEASPEKVEETGK